MNAALLAGELINYVQFEPPEFSSAITLPPGTAVSVEVEQEDGDTLIHYGPHRVRVDRRAVVVWGGELAS